MGIELPQRLLIATGFSICGAAAVAGTEGVTRAKQDQVATAIGLVVLFGTLMIPAMPLLGALLGFDDRSTGMLIGASTHEVAQVVAAGGSVSAAALAVAVTVKLARVALLAPIIAGLGLYMRRKHSVAGGKNPPLIPLFVLGFIVAMLLRTTGILPEPVLSAMSNVQTLLLAAAMFALGLGVHLRSIVKSGGKALVLGLCATLVIIAVATAGTLFLRRHKPCYRSQPNQSARPPKSAAISLAARRRAGSRVLRNREIVGTARLNRYVERTEQLIAPYTVARPIHAGPHRALGSPATIPGRPPGPAPHSAPPENPPYARCIGCSSMPFKNSARSTGAQIRNEHTSHGGRPGRQAVTN